MTIVLSPEQARPWAAASIKKLNTHDGVAYTYTLTHNGQAVASVENGGTGGPTDIRWHGLRRDGTPIPADLLTGPQAAYKKSLPTTMAAYAAWNDLIASLPKVEAWGSMLKVDAGWLAEDILNIAEIRKGILKKILFEIDGKEYAVQGPVTEEARAWVKRKHPNAVILNDLWAPVQAPRGPTLLELMKRVADAKAKP